MNFQIRKHRKRNIMAVCKRFLICATCIPLHLALTAQDFAVPKNRIPVKYSDFMAYVLTYEGKVKTSSLQNECTYYWIKAKQIHSSKGGYEGDLLHGEYTALYRNDALKEKGTYNKGLKVGEWKEWHLNGELKLISHYKKGFARGTFIYYNESGKIVRREYYKSGKLHGRQHVYNDTAETVLRYKRGKLITPKNERLRPERPPREKTKHRKKNTSNVTSDEKNNDAAKEEEKSSHGKSKLKSKDEPKAANGKETKEPATDKETKDKNAKGKKDRHAPTNTKEGNN